MENMQRTIENTQNHSTEGVVFEPSLEHTLENMIKSNYSNKIDEKLEGDS